MRAIILAGGRGSRLDPLTRRLPKPLVPFFGRPLIEHQIRWLVSYGFTDIVISLGHLGPMIESALGPSFAGATLRYAAEETPLGTAGATIRALSEHRITEPVLIIPGDCLADFDLAHIYRYFVNRPEPFGMVVHRIEDARQFGVVEVSTDGRVQRLMEKPATIDGRHLVNTGIYVIKPRDCDWPSLVPLDFAYDVFPQLVSAGQLAALTVDGYWSDLGTLTQHRQSHFDVLNSRVSIPYGLAQSRDVVIDAGARIIGPVWIGDRVTIDAQATVGPFVVVGSDSYIGPWTHVEYTVIGQGTFLGVGTRVQDATIDDRVAIGGRCRVGRQTAIGADSRIGWGTKVNPGSRLGPATRISPMAGDQKLTVAVQS